MEKNKLITGVKYLRRRKTEYGGHPAEADSFLKCIQITPAGAVFFCGDRLEKLTNEEIVKEIIKEV